MAGDDTHIGRWVVVTLIGGVTAVVAVLGYWHTVANDQQSQRERARAERVAAQLHEEAQFEKALEVVGGDGGVVAKTAAMQQLADLARAREAYRSKAVHAINLLIRDASRNPKGTWSPMDQPLPDVAEQAAGVLRTLLQRIDHTGRKYRLQFDAVDLHGKSWNSMRLVGAYAPRVDLRSANLTFARMQDASLRGANLACANLHKAHLQGAQVRDVEFAGANLAGADLRVADPESIDWNRFVGAHWTRHTRWPGQAPPFASTDYDHDGCFHRLVDDGAASPPSSASPSSSASAQPATATETEPTG
jgi:uncharacterized protein YjbI with pentapeptide repeats